MKKFSSTYTEILAEIYSIGVVVFWMILISFFLLIMNTCI